MSSIVNNSNVSGNYVANQTVKNVTEVKMFRSWSPEYLYNEGFVCFSDTMPSWAYALCTQAGVSGTTQPVWPILEGQTIVDGTASWKICDLRRGSSDSTSKSSMPLGTVHYTYAETIPLGTIPLDGQDYAGSLYPDFYKLLVEERLPSITYAQWDMTKSSTGGNVGYIALDVANKRFRAPCVQSNTFIGPAANGTPGSFVFAGAPNIKGEVTWSDNLGGLAVFASPREAMFLRTITAVNQVARGTLGPTNDIKSPVLAIDASRSSAVYGNADTIVPAHIRYQLVMVVSSAAVVNTTGVDIGSILSTLSLKADIDLRNVPTFKSKIVIMTGTVTHGSYIPLPSGYLASDCIWMTSMRDSNYANTGWTWSTGWGMNYKQYCCADATRLVTASVLVRDVANQAYGIAGNANYIIIGVK